MLCIFVKRIIVFFRKSFFYISANIHFILINGMFSAENPAPSDSGRFRPETAEKPGFPLT